jgi:lysozyme
MRKLLFILMVLPFTLNVRAEDPPSMLEKAVSNIKRWEGWHRGKMPYIGFGHRLLPHEKRKYSINSLVVDNVCS